MSSCRQDAGFITVNPTLVHAGTVWLNDATAPPSAVVTGTDQTSNLTTSQQSLRRRGTIERRKSNKQEVTLPLSDSSGLVDTGPPYWSIFVVCVSFVVVYIVVCCLLAKQ